MCAELITARCRMDGRCVPRSDKPRPVIARLGFEPRLSDSESLVLPLHYQANGTASGSQYTDRAAGSQVGFSRDFSESARRKQLPVRVRQASSASDLHGIDWDVRSAATSTRRLVAPALGRRLRGHGCVRRVLLRPVAGSIGSRRVPTDDPCSARPTV